MLSAFQKIIESTSGYLNNDLKYYDIDRIRIYKSNDPDKIDVAIINQYGHIIMGFKPMTYDEAMKLINNAVSEDKFEEQIGLMAI